MSVRHVLFRIPPLLGGVIAHMAGEDLDANIMPVRHVLFQIASLLGAVIAHRTGEDLDIETMLERHVPFQIASLLGVVIALRAREDLDVIDNVMPVRLVPFQVGLLLGAEVAHMAIVPTYAVVFLLRFCQWPHTVTDVGLYHRRWSWRGWRHLFLLCLSGF